jgi:TctA family transporter
MGEGRHAMLDAAIEGLLALLTAQSLMFLVIGVLFGVVIGFLPGLGGVAAMVLLLPFIFGQEPAAVMALLLGAHVATIYNDGITGILFNVPGASKGIALCFDGYPMTQKGQGQRALGAAAMASLVGGLTGVVFLIAILPLTRAIMLALGPPEYFVMGLWGLSVIAVFSEGSVLRGLVAGGLGLLLSFVGQNPITATDRFTFGVLYLHDGIDFAVAAIGLFAISQMLVFYRRGGTAVSVSSGGDRSTVWEGVRDVFQHKKLVLRSSLLGIFVGVLPGLGGDVGAIAAYGQAASTSKDPDSFGKGNVAGVIAPATTLGANEGGGLLPTLGFGIPGGESMAVLLAAFIVVGVVPGPQMLTTGLPLVFSMIWAIVLANILTTGIGLFTAPFFAKLTALPTNLLVPFVLAVCFVGVYAINQQPADVIAAAAFGLLGYALRVHRYSLANVAIGFVLGSILERYLHISITLHGPLFWIERPVTLGLLIFVVVTIAWPFWRMWRRRRLGLAEPVTRYSEEG